MRAAQSSCPEKPTPDEYLGSQAGAATGMCKRYRTVFIVVILLLLQGGLIALSVLLTTKKNLKGGVNLSVSYLNTFK